MRYRVFVLVALVVLLPLPARTGHARPGAVVVRGAEHHAIDWTRGLIIAIGAAAGDLRAPSPEVARMTATRKALEQARSQLLDQARSLEVQGTSVAELAKGNPEIRGRLEHEIEQAVRLDLDHGSDGSAVITVGLPLEAVRTAVVGTPRPEPMKNSPSAVLVDARRVMSRPALGVNLITPKGRFSAPAVFYRGIKPALADPRLGNSPVRVRATRLLNGSGSELRVGRTNGGAARRADQVAAALETGALVIIVIGK